MILKRSNLVCGVVGAVMLGAAQMSWAVVIDPLDGTIRSTTYGTGVAPVSTSADIGSGVFSTGSATYDASITGGDTNKGNASGDLFYIAPDKSAAKFILTTTAEVFSTTTAVISSQSRVFSDGMLEFGLSLTDAEKASGLNAIELTVSAELLGSLVSTGFPLFDIASGYATMDFAFQVFGDAAGTDELASFNYNNSFTNLSGNTQATDPLPNLGSEIISLADGSSVFIKFDQIVTANSSGDMQSGAQAFGVQSQEKLLTLGVKANAVLVPEPSILMLLGLGLIGLGLVQRRV